MATRRRQEEHDVSDTYLESQFSCTSVLCPSCLIHSPYCLPPAHMAAFFANLPPYLDVPDKPAIPWHLWKKIFQVHLKAPAEAAGRTKDARPVQVLHSAGAARSARRPKCTTHNQHAGGVGYGCGVDDGSGGNDGEALTLQKADYEEALTLQKAEEVGRDLEALNKANAAFGENERLLGSHSGCGGSTKCVAAAQNGGSPPSLAPHVTQHGGSFPPSGAAASKMAARARRRYELRRLQDDVIVDGRGRRLHSIVRISNQMFPAQAIRGGPAVQCDSTSAEAQLQLPATQYHPLGLQEESDANGSSKSAPDSRSTQSFPAGPGSRRPQRTLLTASAGVVLKITTNMLEQL
ncbi:hypothetical protein HPB52_022364 [Rhipicephalus sanguineus]|uniref:Uncharacterized protein n=1 Tax=Rhipicephalus sanguineus TaxID=34632 RepID=A0A9D4Q8G5_RHISA|nr:hypothetical protein HPB52_022364 [Rhipicephalus sanguineus]